MSLGWRHRSGLRVNRPTPEGAALSGWALLPLRLFLGVTFLYAGLQKLADPRFLERSSPTSITAQLAGAERSSPIHVLLGGLLHVAPAVGLVIAVGEVAIGLATLVGLWTRVAAAFGALLSFVLFLTVSYHSHPYFTGSDIVFLFAWTPFVIGGAGGAPAVDTVRNGVAPLEAVPLPDHSPAAAMPAQSGTEAMSRRRMLSNGAVTGIMAGLVVTVSAATAWIGRLFASPSQSADGTTTLGTSSARATPHGSRPPTSAPSAGPNTTGPARSKGFRLGSASSVPVGGSASFTDPATGDPGLVIRHASGQFVAFDAVCPHAGCTVAYQRSASIIACPCHGSAFNATTGAVEQGPATSGLAPIAIAEGPDGDLYVDG